jgi:hypothetical protein
VKTLAFWLIVQAGLLALGALFSGCSLLGLAVDAAREPDTLSIDPAEKALAGKNILVTMQDGDSFAGECRRLGNLPPDLYRSTYAAWQKCPENVSFPLAPGDTLHIAWERGKLTACRLEGFTRTSMVILPFPRTPGVRGSRQQALSIPMEAIDCLWTLDGTTLYGRMLRAWLEDRGVPTSDAMLVRRGDTSFWVRMDEIVRIREIRYSYHWFHAGATADAAALAAALVYFAVRQF